MQSSRSGLTVSNLLILCASIILGAGVICGVIIFVASGGFSGIFGGAGLNDDNREEISIQYDGASFKLSPNFGTTVRNLSKQGLKAYDVDYGKYDSGKEAIKDIESLLTSGYKYEDTRLAFMNKKQTAEAFEVQNRGEHSKPSKDVTIADTGVYHLTFTMDKSQSASIDGITIKSDNESELLKKFKDIKVQDSVDNSMGEQYTYREHYLLAKHKGWYIYIYSDYNKTGKTYVEIVDKLHQRY